MSIAGAGCFVRCGAGPMTQMIPLPARKALGAPFLLGTDGTSHKLEPVELGAVGGFKEAWLQQLIHDHPEILPIAQIEPGFGAPVAVVREMACGHGFIDNLFITPRGDIVLVETKLWRNPQARREVIAQALDYVAALMTMDYASFEAAATKAGLTATSLHALVADQADALEESAFFDALARNLKRGRMLVLALGDGIRQEAESLADLVQNQMMAQFTFALVEIKIYRNASTGEIIALPSTLAQTVMIERGILIFNEGVPTIQPVPAKAVTKPKSITEDLFYEALAAKHPALPAAIKIFLAEAAALGVYPDFQASLNLKVDIADAPRPLNIGYIQKNGQLWTNPVRGVAGDTLALAYAQRLADLIGGKVAMPDEIYVTTNGTSAPSVANLLPDQRQGWLSAIQALIQGFQAQQGEQN